MVTVLFVRDYAGVGPFLSHEGLLVLLGSCREFASCHPDVWTLLAVDTFFCWGSILVLFGPHSTSFIMVPLLFVNLRPAFLAMRRIGSVIPGM